MDSSGYQIETMLKRFRRLHGLWRLLKGPPAPGTDQVRFSEEARELAEPAGPPTEPAPAAPGEVITGRHPDDVVHRELERRAGSFMQPPYEPPGEPPRLPKLQPRREE